MEEQKVQPTKPASAPRPAGSRPTSPRPAGARPAGSRPFTPRPAGSRPFTPRPAGQQGSRPFTPRPAGSRPFTPRPAGSRPFTPRPAGQEGSRPSFGGPRRPFKPGEKREGGFQRKPGERGGRPFRKDAEKERDGFNESVLDLRRVTRVVAGGKRFRFRATVVIGDGKGTIGVGVAKGADVQSAVSKAKTAAKKKLVTFKIVEGTIPHETKAKFSAAQVIIRPAKPGHGLMAGGAVRSVLLLAGVKDVTAKCLGGTKNKLTNAMATVAALQQLKSVK